MRKFRILIIDDNEIVIERIQQELSGRSLIIGGKKWLLDVESVLVETTVIKKKKRAFEITDSTIHRLSSACSKKYDLLLIDYGYIKGKAESALTNILNDAGSDFKPSLLHEVLLSPVDIANKAIKLNEKKVKKTFLGHKGEVIVYTYTPPGYKKFYPSSGIKENIARKVFTHSSNIRVINTSETIYNDVEFKDHYKDDYYSYIISKYLELEVSLCIANRVLLEKKSIDISQAMRFLVLVTAVGATLGAATEFSGGLIFKLLLENHYGSALFIFATTAITVLIGGRYIFKFFEQKLSNYLTPDIK